ncbi:hypothetical protein [Weissella jogaejeotgali]|uniref:hypothetical protein n=1 Tax=Weissella jogaejeotgali TaxID=1631871 RepID=UPI0012EBB15C|nr:hypothetical protein [Weissella jogaejeotgali]
MAYIYVQKGFTLKAVGVWEKQHHENYSDDFRLIDMNVKEIKQLQRQNEALRAEINSK